MNYLKKKQKPKNNVDFLIYLSLHFTNDVNSVIVHMRRHTCSTITEMIFEALVKYVTSGEFIIHRSKQCDML